MPISDRTLDAHATDDTVRVERQVTADDLDRFIALSGDANPLHADAAFARSRGFRDRVVHGALLGAFVSELIGMRLPGRRSQLASLTLDFAAPTYPGDRLEIEATVKSVHPATRVVVLRIAIRCGAELRVRGSAIVRVEEDDVVVSGDVAAAGAAGAGHAPGDTTVAAAEPAAPGRTAP